MQKISPAPSSAFYLAAEVDLETYWASLSRKGRRALLAINGAGQIHRLRPLILKAWHKRLGL